MRAERGSATLGSVFAIVLLMLLTLGTMQVAFLLYARNMLLASAHEAARVAIERGVGDIDAKAHASQAVEGAVGGMVEAIRIEVERGGSPVQQTVVVVIRASVRPTGPVPIEVPVRAVARLSAPAEPL